MTDRLESLSGWWSWLVRLVLFVGSGRVPVRFGIFTW